MKARLPKEYQNRGANNMNSMIKQAQKMRKTSSVYRLSLRQEISQLLPQAV